MRRDLLITYAALFVLMFSPLFVWASTEPDAQKVALGAINALIPILTPVAVYFLRKVWVRIPRALIAPVVAPLVGVGLDFLFAWLSGNPVNPLVGAVLGAAGTWLREVVSVPMKYGVKPNPTPKLIA